MTMRMTPKLITCLARLDDGPIDLDLPYRADEHRSIDPSKVEGKREGDSGKVMPSQEMGGSKCDSRRQRCQGMLKRPFQLSRRPYNDTMYR